MALRFPCFTLALNSCFSLSHLSSAKQSKRFSVCYQSLPSAAFCMRRFIPRFGWLTLTYDDYQPTWSSIKLISIKKTQLCEVETDITLVNVLIVCKQMCEWVVWPSDHQTIWRRIEYPWFPLQFEVLREIAIEFPLLFSKPQEALQTGCIRFGFLLVLILFR